MKWFIMSLLLLCSLLTIAQSEKWQPTASPKGNAVLCLESTEKYLYAGIAGIGLLRTPDVGETWDTVGNGFISLTPTDMLQTERYTYVSTFYNGVFISSDEGENWKQVNEGLGTLITTSLVKKDDEIFVGTAHGVYVLKEGESQWKALPFPRSRAINQHVHCLLVDDNNILAGSTNSLYVSSNGGSEWIEVPNVTRYSIISIAKKGNKSLLGTSGNGILESEGSYDRWVKSSEFAGRGQDTATIVTVLFQVDSNSVLKGTNRYGIFNENSEFNVGLEDLEIRAIARHKGKFFAGTQTNGVVIFDIVGQNLDSTNLLKGTDANLLQLGIPTLNVQPNPANQYATLSFSLPSNEWYVSIGLLSGEGRLIRNVIANQLYDAGVHALQLDLTGLPTGIYYCVLDTKEHRLSRQLIISR